MSNGILLPLALVISFVWGVTPLVHRYFLGKVSVDTLLVLNGLFYGIAIFWLALTQLPRISRELQALHRMHIATIAMTALVGLFLAHYAYFHLLSEQPGFWVAAFVAISPMFTLGLSYWFLQERMTPSAVIGVVLIVTGVVFLMHHSASTA